MLSAYRGNAAATGASTSGKAILMALSGTQVLDPILYETLFGLAGTIAAGVLAINAHAGNYFTVSLNANITSFTIANPGDTTRLTTITLKFTADGTVRTITWPAGTVWAGASAPTMTGTLNKHDFIRLISDDAGTTWFGFILGQNF